MRTAALRTITYIALSLALSYPLPAQAALPQSVRPPAARDTLAERQRELDSATISLLRAQNALMREYDQRLLATVYWSLGGVTVLVGLLVGFSWFTNFRVYERDKLLLRQEIAAGLRDDLAKLKEEAAENAKRTEVALTKIATQAATAVDARLKAAQQILETKITALELEMAEQQAEEWRQRKVYTNEIRSTLSMIQLAKKLSRPFMVSRALDRLQESFRAGARPDADLAAQVVTALDGLSSEYGTEVETLKLALRSARQA
ncbi:hypothetical protein [Gemmatimonas sp.]|jgi:predicted negative regulator of RcsB-dependent stress response|uniref:hypothetical protein n=1 Tax=Gemmatimonas sp. TaxID=1962908 RepID=UPI0022CADAC6|nr:hypothetical protein [Gemmatimonas sp.]MCZ8206555.1 hypothetical protein [Gemmatimonas sp.]